MNCQQLNAFDEDSLKEKYESHCEGLMQVNVEGLADLELGSNYLLHARIIQRLQDIESKVTDFCCRLRAFVCPEPFQAAILDVIERELSGDMSLIRSEEHRLQQEYERLSQIFNNVNECFSLLKKNRVSERDFDEEPQASLAGHASEVSAHASDDFSASSLSAKTANNDNLETDLSTCSRSQLFRTRVLVHEGRDRDLSFYKHTIL